MPPRLSSLLTRLSAWRAPGAAAAQPGDPRRMQRNILPEKAAVHLLLDDGLAHLEDGRLVLATADGARRHLQIDQLAQLCLHGRAGVTSPAIRALMAAGIPVIWRDETGRVVGMACDMTGSITQSRRAQFDAQRHPARRLAIAAALVGAKISATRGMMRRREVPGAVLQRLDALAVSATHVGSIPQLLGVEGAAADLAFAQWPRLIDTNTGFVFQGRRRRPPPDPVNALLSYAYAVVAGEAFAAALAAGLDPHAGFLHTERAGRPALALDLMEPLRPLLAERAVLSIVNRREVRPDDFTTGDDGVRLMPQARKALLAALETRLGRPIPVPMHEPGQTPLTLREAISEEALTLARALRADTLFASRFAGR